MFQLDGDFEICRLRTIERNNLPPNADVITVEFGQLDANRYPELAPTRINYHLNVSRSRVIEPKPTNWIRRDPLFKLKLRKRKCNVCHEDYR